MTHPKQRLSFAPLVAALGQVFVHCPGNDASIGNLGDGSCWQEVEGVPTSMLAELTGFSARTLHRWVHDGVPVDEADRIAVKLGMHVAEIWPEWWSLVVQEPA